jgi:alginate O-acetyltransferase complex protein AlgI
MIFSSPAFLFVFLPLCILGFALFGRFGRRSAIGFLVLMSFVFYAQWSRIYLLLLVGSILFNYAISRLIARSAGSERVQSAWLTFGIVADLTCLGYFKYFFPLLNFFTGIGLTHRNWGSTILPLGISFFTFTQIAYLIDLKQGAAERESLLSYFFFVTFFPHLIAGPILHHKEIMPQLREERRYGLYSADVELGLTWFSMGLFKKVVVADNISPMADLAFANAHQLGLWGSWLGALTYSMQLYFDFSGYSDMAIGLARIFSIRFPFNFSSPYKAQNIIEFWQRWHMTLTRYIMAYLYGPIQFWISDYRQSRGLKVSKRAQATFKGFMSMIAMPTIFTMLVVGVWHGAGLQFIVFGLMHGCFLTINHMWRVFLPLDGKLRRMMSGPPAILITYLCAMSAQVMFRASSVRNALSVYAGMMGRHGIGPRCSATQLAVIVLLFAVVWLMPNTQEILGQEHKDDQPNWSIVRPTRWQAGSAWWIAAIYGAAWAFAIAMLPLGSRPFIYFQF